MILGKSEASTSLSLCLVSMKLPHINDVDVPWMIGQTTPPNSYLMQLFSNQFRLLIDMFSGIVHTGYEEDSFMSHLHSQIIETTNKIQDNINGN